MCLGVHAGALANVATTSGDNLTAYNGGASSNNNSWNTKSNARQNVAAPAKADFGNCELVIMRCATPKCSSGGCVDISVARPIVAGCVTSNSSCKKHGDALIDTIAGQLVAKSTASANAQAQAAAQAAAAQSSAQVEQMQMQMQQMQQSMQESMSAMQSQMQQQNAAANAQLQNALEEQRALMNEAQAAAAAAAESEPELDGLSAAEKIAVKNNMDSDVLVRSQMTGQIEQSILDAELKVKQLKETLQRLLTYGGCDSSANNCTGPKRVKKFKDIANEFFDPFDDVADKMYDAVDLAMSLGVDISDVYMMLSGACNRWGKYMCDICPDAEARKGNGACFCNGPGHTNCYYRADANENGLKGEAKEHCRIIGMISDTDEVQQEWLDANTGMTGSVQVACASNLGGALLGRSRKRKSSTSVSIDTLRELLNQDITSGLFDKEGKKSSDNYNVCYRGNMKTYLQNQSKKKRFGLTCYEPSGIDWKTQSNASLEDDGCNYLDPAYALCTVHAYNVNKPNNPTESSDIQEMHDIIALKTTLIAQQMKQQYDMLSSTVRKLKTQLEKAVLTTKMDILTGNDSTGKAGGKAAGVSVSGATNCSAAPGGTTGVLTCLQTNLGLIASTSSKSEARKQLKDDIEIAKKWGLCPNSNCCKDVNKVDDCVDDFRIQLTRSQEALQKEDMKLRYGVRD